MTGAAREGSNGTGGTVEGGAPVVPSTDGDAGQTPRAGVARTGGIAGLAQELGYPETVPCPFCETSETELHSPFGSALSVATYWCRSCRTAFEWIKWG